MEHVFRSYNDSFRSVFKSAVTSILTDGKEVRPRGMLTKEISPATLIVDPKKSLYFSPHRSLNFAFLFAENLWYLSGRADTHFLSYYNSNIKNFSEDGLHDGNYGSKIISQIRYIVDTLTQDKDSRQAIISLWRDNPRPSKDIPCTLTMQFLIRDGALNMYVQMRSNDIIWGSCYDVPSFSLIQMVVASCLGLQPGMLYHTANSLHLYETHFSLAQELVDEYFKVEELNMQPAEPSYLENHSQQWDMLQSIESSMRNFGEVNLNIVQKIKDKLNSFYQIYAFTFLWFIANKKKDNTMKNIAVIELERLRSPLANWYKSK